MYPPRNVKDVQSFLGFCNFYKRFIQDFAHIAYPLTQLTRNSTEWKWTHKCQKAYEMLKQRVISAPILAYPNLNKPLILYTDVSDYGIGAAVHQIGEDTLHKAEVNWTITEKECLAVVWRVLKFRHYLDNEHKFIIYTDHQALVTFRKDNTNNPRRARWKAELSYFDFELRHRPGEKMKHVDFLYRQVEPTIREM